LRIVQMRLYEWVLRHEHCDNRRPYQSGDSLGTWHATPLQSTPLADVNGGRN
jgi:hypothetical protein